MGYEAYNIARDSTLAQGRAQMAQMDDMIAQRTRRQAGNALAGGDYAGASNALLQGGDLQGGLAVQNAERSRQTADRDQQRTAILAVVTGLRHLPPEQRAAQLQAIAPRLSVYGVTPEQLATVTPQDLSDQGLDSLIATMGGEVPRAQAFNTRDGIVERDPYGGGYNMAYEVEQEQPVPTGYYRDEAGRLQIDPGYLEGQRQLSGARRAPPRPRSGGGGSRPSGGSAPAPSGGGLPAGFTVRRR